MIYRDNFFDTMERVRTAKEEKHYFPKASNQPAMVEQPNGALLETFTNMKTS
jgi:hypothetical protein